jgi:hypothetical protein
MLAVKCSTAHKLPGEPFSFLSDLFSAGCVLLAMMLRVDPAIVDKNPTYWTDALRCDCFRYCVRGAVVLFEHC